VAPPRVVRALVRAILDKAIIFGADSHEPSLGQRTGGLHACALADQIPFSASTFDLVTAQTWWPRVGYSGRVEHFSSTPQNVAHCGCNCRGWRASFVEKMFRRWRVAGSRKASSHALSHEYKRGCGIGRGAERIRC